MPAIRESVYAKVKSRLWRKVVALARKKDFYPRIYRSFWHYRFNGHVAGTDTPNYFTAVPNRGAGIGHQLANWIAGYWFARQLGLRFAYLPFSSQAWDDFFGFSEQEVLVTDLVERHGYRKVRIPLFDERNPEEVLLVKKIIHSYEGRRIVFVAEQDQFYHDQFGVMEDLQRKFHSAVARKSDRLVFAKENLNIAVHIRRGDIVAGQTNGNENLKMRWQNETYFINVLSAVLKNISPSKRPAVYLFSQGKKEDFSAFAALDNVTFCLEMKPMDCFLHMTCADLLITSKSSFSYSPALLSRGVKIVPRDFWHGYPDSKQWILADEAGNFDINALKVIS